MSIVSRALLAVATLALILGAPQAHAQDVFISSLGNNNVGRYNSAGVSQGAFASTGINEPYQIAFSPTNGDLYVTSSGTNQVRRYNGTTGAFVEAYSASGVTGITFNAAGDFFVCDYSGGTVTRFNSAGVNQGIFASGLFGSPFMMTTAANGDILVGQYNGDEITRLNGSTGAASLFASTNVFRPTGLAFGSDGNLYVANQFGNSIDRYNGTTGAFIGTFSSAGLFNNLQGIAFAPDGRLLVANTGNNNVLAITSTGTQSVFASGINSPRGIAFRGVGSATAPEPATLALTLGIGVPILMAGRRVRRKS